MSADRIGLASGVTTGQKVSGCVATVGAAVVGGLLADYFTSSAFAIIFATMVAYFIVDGILTSWWGYGWSYAGLFSGGDDA